MENKYKEFKEFVGSLSYKERMHIKSGTAIYSLQRSSLFLKVVRGRE
jgi:hypothetical protein